MERCLEEIGAAVLDAGEPISYRTLSIRSHVSNAVSVEALAHFLAENEGAKALHVLVTQQTSSEADKSETAAATRDPRARVLTVTVKEQEKEGDVLCQQIYALYSGGDDAAAVATACWAQERQARNDALSSVDKHAPLSGAAKALYASGVQCAEASARQDFGEEQGEETISAFDSINASAITRAAPSSSSFFKSSGKTGLSKSGRNGRKASSKVETKKLDMSNVLTVDSDEEEDDETDAPVFVKTSNGRGKRIISDDEDEEDEPAKAATIPAPKSRNVKRKLNASPAETKKAKPVEESEEETRSNKQRAESENEADSEVDAVVEVATKRRVLVSKTRINEQGYMVTEKTYEEVELTPEEIEKEQKDAKKKLDEKKKKTAAEKAAKAKKEAKKHSGPPKQRDLRSFFSAK
ncbi:hypothetical protein PRIC2_013607 [Phytophthora ramorum]